MTQTIQQTGKKYKAGIALGMFLLIVSLLVAGFMHLVQEPDIRNAALIAAGCAYFVVILSKIGAWWHHA